MAGDPIKIPEETKFEKDVTRILRRKVIRDFLRPRAKIRRFLRSWKTPDKTETAEESTEDNNNAQIDRDPSGNTSQSNRLSVGNTGSAGNSSNNQVGSPQEKKTDDDKDEQKKKDGTDKDGEKTEKKDGKTAEKDDEGKTKDKEDGDKKTDEKKPNDKNKIEEKTKESTQPNKTAGKTENDPNKTPDNKANTAPKASPNTASGEKTGSNWQPKQPVKNTGPKPANVSAGGATQPGRIAPKQLPVKTTGAASATKGVASASKGAAASVAKSPQNAKAAAVNKVTSMVVGKSLASDADKRYKKALEVAHKTGVAPRVPEYRIKLFEGAIVMAFCFIVDLIEFIIGLIIVTEPIVIIIDIIVGIIMTAWLALYHRVPFASHWQRYASLLAALIGEAIPYLDVCSFWFLDAWYIIHSIREEDRQTHQKLMQTLNAEQQEREQQEWMANYEQQQAAQAQEEQEEDAQMEDEPQRMAA